MWTIYTIKGYIGHYAKLLAFLALAIAAAATTWISTHNQIEREHDSTTATFVRERNAQLRVCERVQFLRDQANGTNFLVYDTFKEIADRQDTLIKSGGLTGRLLDQTKKSRDRAQKVVDTTFVTGPTDCVPATDQPDTYTAPAPVFVKANDDDQVKILRERYRVLVDKAEHNIPLYQGLPLPGKG